MSISIKGFLKSTGVYFLGNILSKMITFFLLPLYTGNISPENFGRYDMAVNYVNLFSTVCFIEIWMGLMRYVIDSQEEKRKRQVIYSSSVIYFVSVILYTGSFLLFGLWKQVDHMELALVYGVTLTLQNYYGYTARAYGHSVLFAVSGVAATLLTVLLNIVMILFLRMDTSALFIASIAGILLQVIILEAKLRLISGFSPSLVKNDIVRSLLRYCLPFCLNSVAYWFLSSFNRIMVGEQLSAAQDGMYAVAVKLSAVINLLGSCFTLSWQETAYKKSSETQETGEFYSKAGKLYLDVLLAGSLVLIPLAGTVFDWFVDESYAQARVLVPLSLLGAAASLYSVFLGNIFGAAKKTGFICISMVASCVLNVVLMVVLLPVLEAQAATVALFVGFSFNCLLRLLMLKKVVGMKVNALPLLIYAPLLTAVSLICVKCGFAANAVATVVAAGIAVFVLKDFMISLIKSLKGKIA